VNFRRACTAYIMSFALTCMHSVDANAEGSGRDLYQGIASFSKGVSSTNRNIPVAFSACENCHGRNGAGAKEGGTAAPSIQWSSLKRSRDSRPPYASRQDVIDAITQGKGRGGEFLSSAMPRYDLSGREQEQIVEYLSIVGTPSDSPRGVTTTSVRFGTLLPLRGPLQSAGKSALRGMQSVFDRTNEQSSIYGRRLELVAADSTLGTAQSFNELERQQVFAIVGGLWQQDGADMEVLLRKNQISAIASLNARERAQVSDSWNFPLLAAKDKQMKALLSALTQCPDGQPALVLATQDLTDQPYSKRITAYPTLIELNAAVAESGTNGCLGIGMGNMNGISAAKSDQWKQFVALPFPSELFGTQTDIWQNLGEAAAKIAVELLSASGSSLHEHSLLDHITDLDGFSPLEGIMIKTTSKTTSVFQADIVTIDTFNATTTR
jgi:Periplasmic binding protein